MTANSIHLRVPSNEKNTEKTLDNKKGDKLTDNDRAFGHWPLLCNDLGVCSGRQKQKFDKRTHNVYHDSSVSARTLDIIIQSVHWCATVPTTFTVLLKRQVPSDVKSKPKT